MSSYNSLAVKDFDTDATSNALDNALAQAGINSDRVVAIIHFSPDRHAAFGLPLPHRYRVLYRG